VNWVGSLEISPSFSEFPGRDAPDHNSTEFHCYTGLGIRGLPAVADRNFVALGDDVFDHDPKVGITFKCRLEVGFRSEGSRSRIGRGVTSVFAIIRGKIAVGDIQVFLVHKFLKMAAHKCFVLFARHNGAGGDRSRAFTALALVDRFAGY